MLTMRFWRIIGCLSLLMIEGGWVNGQERTSMAALKVSDIRDRYVREKDDLKKLAVQWVLRFELQVDPKIAAQIDGTTDSIIMDVHTAFKGAKLLYDQKYAFTSGKHRYPDGLKREAVAYDGDTTQWCREHWDPMKSSWVRLTSGDTTNQSYAHDEYMASHGLPKTSSFRMLAELEPVPLDLAEFLRDDVYQVEPNLQPAADGTPCVVVKGGRDRIWFDPKLNLALRQREWQHQKHAGPAHRLRLADFVECAPKTWMANTVYMDCFCDSSKYPVPAGRPYKTGVLRVSELKVDSVPDSLFRLKLGPGTWVEDATQFERKPDGTLPIVNYSIPADPTDLDHIIQLATAARAQSDRDTAVRHTFLRWALLINAVLIGAYVAYRLYKRYQKYRTV